MADLLGKPLEPLDDTLDRSAFSSGVEALDRYFRVQAGQDQRRHVAACFVLVDAEAGAVAGYYTLSAYSITAGELPPSIQKRLPRYGRIPCTLLGRLALDQRYRGRGLGDYLVADALRRALHGSTDIASWAVIVDAKDEATVPFYERHGFTRFASAPMSLFLPMRTIAASIR